MKRKTIRFEANHEFGLEKHKSTNEISNKVVVPDRISELPDEILVSIVSKLSIEAAARSSILSHRWEKLWLRFEGNLEFDISTKLNNIAEYDWPEVKYDHVKSMNQVLRSLRVHRSPLSSLIIRFQYHWSEMYQKILTDIIVGFLKAKRIRILDFDMGPLVMANSDLFSFPVEFYAFIKQPHTISALTSLSLKNVSVSGDTVEYFVANCPLLERLCVLLSNRISNLRIVGDASLKLNYLKIQNYGPIMKSLVVSAPNLVFLNFYGYSEIKLDVSNVPKLVELGIGRHLMTYMPGSLSTYLAQIHTLKLYFSGPDMIPMNFTLTPNVVFSNLKHLVLRVLIGSEDESLLGFTSSLLEASPMLEKFTLSPITGVIEHHIGLKKMTTIPSRKQYSHQRLKVVEFIYFAGLTPEVELLVYFVENFESLEQIIIDSSSPFDMKTPYEHRQARKERGLQLMKHIPPGVDFVLI